MNSYKKNIFLLFFITLIYTSVWAQTASIYGKVVMQENGQPVAGAAVVLQNTSINTVTNDAGMYRLSAIKPGTYEIIAFLSGLKSAKKQITVGREDLQINFELDSLHEELNEVTVNSTKANNFGIDRLNSVEGTAIYEAKKTEVVVLADINANVAANNSRQIFAKVAGLNVWESDGGGIQLGIGARGLSPNRTSEFNTRQNGYDISADALGYPEAYYTPPAEALQKIEVVRGAASLQYGTQFGGMINFVFKKGPVDKPIEVVSRQTVGSFGFFNSFNSVGGTKGKLNYYTFYQYKRSDGWRENSNFSVHTAFASLRYKASNKLTLGMEYTFMNYLTRQPGGLTDTDFEINPRKSSRSRNWFELNWNLASITADYQFSSRTRLNIRNFGLIASREALGSLGYISRPDDNLERDLMSDHYRNFGNETRLIHTYQLLKNTSTFLIGTRYYNGFTKRQQGYANSTQNPDFYFLHPNNLEHSDYDFPGGNVAAFAENIFTISPRLSITPGVRFEYIKTTSKGYYNEEYVLFDGDNTIIKRNKIYDNKLSKRSFPLFGIGVSYRPLPHMELYGNFSQNYRAINFNDLRVFNPNIEVDENLKDENGFNADLGFRGTASNFLTFDVSAFFLSYNDRIGSVLAKDLETSRIYRYRTNIADSRHIGIESFVEADILKLLSGDSLQTGLSVFSNITALNAQYYSDDKRFNGKKVELAPSLIIRSGITFSRKAFSTTLQYSYTGEQFTDASNALRSPTAIEGLIPAYYVVDLSASYSYKRWIFAAGVNNLTNNMYFTRRAISYPGPGLIPADGRNVYLTLGIKI